MPLRQQSATVLFSVSEIPLLALSKPEGNTATIDQFDFGIANLNANDVRAKLRERRLKSDSTSKEFVHVLCHGWIPASGERNRLQRSRELTRSGRLEVKQDGKCKYDFTKALAT